MKLSVVIPTRGDQNMKNIIACLQKQTFKDFEVIFVVDRHLAKEGEFASHGQIRYITNLNSSFRTQRNDKEPMIGGNASTLRNYGIKSAKGEFILLMDDDEWFENDYLEQNIQLREKYKPIVGKDFVLSPTLMYRKSGHVQNYGFSHFNYWMSRPEVAKMGKKEWIDVQMYSGNSLFAPAYIFKQHLFDERLDFVAEDLDFTRGLTYAGYPLIVLRDLKIYHMEREKTKLEEAWVGNEYSAYRKTKHRRIFVKKYASKTDKIKFYLLGVWGQSGRLGLKVLLFGKGISRRKIMRAIVRGTFTRL